MAPYHAQLPTDARMVLSRLQRWPGPGAAGRCANVSHGAGMLAGGAW